ncbi:MAG TPA: chitobiase/beta-hexosaminidase C-terminal domain-containing protein [Gaiellaceae bacterium]|nr:chitobiase/beta-hexosaminidase C-terminal domain-containing protein [Gaiellaceae bacterium]
MAVVVFAVVFVASFGQSSPRAAGGQTIVSITFDDGVADQTLSHPILKAKHMVATYYLNSARIGGDPAYMTWNNVAQLSADGNEIAGHTSYHEDLTAIDPVEAQREICYDRVNLITHGYNVTDFAYPFGDNNAQVQGFVQQCGYATGRTVQDFPVAPFSGTNNPPNPYALQIGTASSTIAALELAVTKAEQNGGGWVPLVFHHICNSCDPDYITQGDFQTFINWLAGEETAGRVATQTVQQFLGGTFNPAVAGPPLPPAVNGANGLKNSSLELDVNGDQTPDCWNFDDFGNNTFKWTRTSDAHSGSFGENLVVTNYVDGDNKLDGVTDLGFCEPTVTPGHQYLITEWYKSSTPTYFTVFNRADTSYQQNFWTSSPNFPAASTWTKASWVTPVIPAGTNGISFGLTLGGNGSLTVDDISLTDNNQTSGPDTTAPTVSLTSPSAGLVSGNVTISATASDNVAVDHLDFLVDGNSVGSTMIPPYSFNWNSHSISNGPHQISVRAVDTSGNARTTTPVTVTVSNQNTNLLQNPGLESGAGNTPTCWQLGGYGTNTAAWTWTNDAHGGNAAENLNITSYTNGDRKLLTQFNTCSVGVTPGHSYTISAWYKGTAKPSIFTFLSSTGPTGSYAFLANSPQQPLSAAWTQATWSTSVMPAGATNLSIGLGLTGQAGSVTMDDFSMTDNAPPPDTTPPTSDILCNGGGENSGCQTGYYNAPVTVTLSAVDNNGGSGLNKIVYTTDGSTPTATNGSTYTGDFVVPTTATIKFRAIDNSGNLEAVNSQLIQIDTISPTASIQCNGNGCGSFFSSAVSVTLSMADTGGSGNGEIFYTTDGTDPGPMNGSFYLGSFSVSQSSTVKFISYDAAGNESQIYSQAIQVDTTAPVSVIRCGSVACQPTPYNAPVLVSFNSSDAGSGVVSVFYTTDGSTPTQSNGNVYLAPFSLPATATVRYRALDNAGNLEPVNAQTITVDTTPPTAFLTAPSAGSSLRGVVGLTASASDNLTVAHVDFLVDGSVVSTDDTAPYSFNWNSASVADGTHTLDARAVDTAGNSTTSSDVSVVTDQIAPSSTISCNSTTCQTSAYGSAVTVSLAATDPTPGSGVAAIVYTTDGTDPTLAAGNFYTSPFAISTTKTVKFRSFDVAGNAEAVQSQTITVAQESVSLTAPADGSTVDGTAVPLSATVSNGTPDRVDFLVGGTVVGTASSAPYTFSWDSTTVADGPYTVKAEAVTGSSTVDSQVANVTVQNTNPPPPDTIPPTSTIMCNGAACQIQAYTNPVSVTLAATDDPGGSGVSQIIYTTDGTAPSLTNGTTYTAPFGVQTTTTIEYRAYDVAGNAEATNVQTVNIDLSSNGIALTAPSTGDVLSGTVPLSATVTGPTPDRVDFLADGTVVGSAGTAPYTINWDSTTVSDGQHSIKAQAVVGATRTDSNTATVTVQNITPPPPDTTPPSSQISCNFLDCTSGFYSSAVSVTLTATDNAGGSGVAEIRYTTDGTTPTATHGRVYGGNFSVPTTTTVLYRAFDNAGNAEAVNSQWIEVDTTAPSSTVKCNGATCTGTFYNAPVQISLTGSDNAGGSGLNKIVYTTDGSDPTASNGTVYSAPFTLSASAGLRYRAIDNVGNLEPVNSAQLQIDTTAPTTSILCAGVACTTSHPYQPGLQITLSASDGSGGSGVVQTRYTTDGTVPTKTTGQIYSGPFTIAATTTFHFRSYDTVGNLEADNIFQVQIDGTAPTVSLTAPAANSLAAGQVTLSANASDNVGVSKVDFLVDGTVVGTATSAPFSYSWASGSVSDGVHTIAARATDTAGNTATTGTINVTTTNTNLLQNPGLETGSGSTPTCWVLAGYGTNTPTWTWTTDAHSGAKAENLTVTGYTNGDRKMLQAFNATCATATSAGHQYTVSVWYKSTAATTIFEFGSTTGPTGAYNWMAQSPVLPVAANWTLASWTTPVVPANFTNISIGMGMQNAGSLTMDDFGLSQTK